MRLKSTLFKHLLLPLNEIARGRKQLSILRGLEKNQWLPPEELEILQLNKLKALLIHAYNNVPYYKRRFDEENLSLKDIKTKQDFLRVPILTKDDIRRNLGDLIARNSDRQLLIKSGTGGSTGEPIQFFYDYTQADYRYASLYMGDRWAGWNFGDKYLWLWPQPYMNSLLTKLITKTKIYLKNQLILNAFDITEEKLSKYVYRIQKFKPKVILGYRSSLVLLAKFIKQKKIDIASPQAIISSAEVLFEHQRKLLEDAFNCKVFNRYGSREVGLIAAECPEYRNMHINSCNLYVEFLKNVYPVNNGEIGAVTITDLHNYAMPFIRYRNGDMAKPIDKLCPCGRGLPLIENLEGRFHDIISTNDGRLLTGMFFTHLFKDIEGVKQFQVIQKTKDNLSIKMSITSEFNYENMKYLKNEIHKKIGLSTKINFEFVDNIPQEKSGKYRVTISEVPIEF